MHGLRKGFTFVELLLVITVILILVTISGSSYSTVLKKSRDAKRKGDLESVRSALEIYRSNNSFYPQALSTLVGPPVYIQNIPQDPLVGQNYTYQYQGLPSACNNTPGNYCTDYTIGAYLEAASTCSTPPSTRCYGSTNCNYCLGPYGQK